jgi:hypothetical protein
MQNLTLIGRSSDLDIAQRNTIKSLLVIIWDKRLKAEKAVVGVQIFEHVSSNQKLTLTDAITPQSVNKLRATSICSLERERLIFKVQYLITLNYKPERSEFV